MACYKTILIIFVLCIPLFAQSNISEEYGLKRTTNFQPYAMDGFIGDYPEKIDAWYAYAYNGNTPAPFEPMDYYNAYGTDHQVGGFTDPTVLTKAYFMNLDDTYSFNYLYFTAMAPKWDATFQPYQDDDGKYYYLGCFEYGKVDGYNGIEVCMFQRYYDYYTNLPTTVNIRYTYLTFIDLVFEFHDVVIASTGSVDYRGMLWKHNSLIKPPYTFHELGTQDMHGFTYWTSIVETYPLYNCNISYDPHVHDFNQLELDQYFDVTSIHEDFANIGDMYQDCSCVFNFSLPWVDGETFDYSLAILPGATEAAGVDISIMKDIGRLFLLFNIAFFFISKIYVVIREY